MNNQKITCIHFSFLLSEKYFIELYIYIKFLFIVFSDSLIEVQQHNQVSIYCFLAKPKTFTNYSTHIL